MATWKEMLREAKEVFDEGLISETEYDELRKEALTFRKIELGLVTKDKRQPSNISIPKEIELSGRLVDVIVPNIGESITEISDVEIKKQVGEVVKENETILMGESDKIGVEIISPVSGVVAQILAQEGENFPVGEVIARVNPIL